MRRPHRLPLLLAALGLVLAAGAGYWALQTDGRDATPPTGIAAHVATDTPATSTVSNEADSTQAALTISEYRPNTAGLPPIDTPLNAQIPALREAAARGNTTAACRLAVIGSQCVYARTLAMPSTPEQAAAMTRDVEDTLRRQYADVSLEGLPERYRAYAQQRLDTDALQRFDRPSDIDAWRRRCADAPAIPHDEVIASLRQAALGGEPDSMVRYASGEWLIEPLFSNQIGGFGGRPTTAAWLASPALDQWRREAAVVRRAGLERGDPEMLRFEFAVADPSGLRLLEPADPIDSAAALRAYAALIGGHSPESTATLGLSVEQAAEADRRSDAWAARARERGRRAEAVADGRFAGGLSACD